MLLLSIWTITLPLVLAPLEGVLCVPTVALIGLGMLVSRITLGNVDALAELNRRSPEFFGSNWRTAIMYTYATH